MKKTFQLDAELFDAAKQAYGASTDTERWWGRSW
jgi:hypothetical protein